ncbi:hypothetical protein [Kribbella sp. NPDC050459]|uniref:hypothetical protein n=1 Tax=Kribbella sp. NPDC050459 TaxID=3155785 RepID=UPI0034094D2F
MRLKTCILVALTGSVLTAVPAAAQQAGEQDGSLRWATTATNRQPATFNDVATGAGGTWAVGGDRNGTKWQVVKPPAVPAGSFDDVVIAPDASVWVTGWADVGGKERAVVYRYAGGKWRALNAGLEGSVNGNVLAVLSAKNAWLGLNAGLAHFDGKRWTLVTDLPTDGSQIPTAMAAAGPKNIWLVGVQYTSGIAPLALHYNGTKWTKVAVPAGMAQLYDVALRDNRPVVVGEQFKDNQTATPYVLQLSGSKLVAAPAPNAATGTLTGIETAKDRVWTVGMSAASTQSPFTALAAFTR